MDKDFYKNMYKHETSENWLNSQGEPDIDYVEFLEKKLTILSDKLAKIFQIVT